MALIFADLVQETTSTTGVGTLTLTGAVAGFQTFSAIGNANTTYYKIKSGNDSEVGLGTYTSSGTTLSRDTVLYSTAGGTTKITVASGATVICAYPAEKVVIQDASGTINNAGAVNITGAFALRGSHGTGGTASNFAAGDNALGGGAAGGSNTAVGVNALGGTTSSSNTAVGNYALGASSTGSSNSVAGRSAMPNNTSGSYNVAMGLSALNGNTTGSRNTAIGEFAGRSSSTSSYNVAIGAYSLNTSTGASNVGIGYASDTSTTTIANEVNIYNGTVVARFQGAAAAWTFVSDVRDKTNIENLTLGLDFINSLQPRKFTWDLRHTAVDRGKEASGFIAQEVQAIVEANNASYTGLVDTNNSEQYTFASANLIPMLVNAVKELTARLEILEGK